MAPFQRFITSTQEQTHQLGHQLGTILGPNTILSFFGDLGVGKTTMIRGIVNGVSFERQNVKSPTFNFLNIYEGIKPIYHFDLYRLQGPDEFFSMGFDEYFNQNGICCIEWAERLGATLPDAAISIKLAHLSDEKREIKLFQSPNLSCAFKIA